MWIQLSEYNQAYLSWLILNHWKSGVFINNSGSPEVTSEPYKRKCAFIITPKNK